MARVLQGKRVLFDGDVEHAEEFVQNNFPRLHSEPNGGEPTPDVYLDDDGARSYFNGDEWVSESDKKAAPAKSTPAKA